MSKLSRRETLAATGKVIAAAAVLPFIPAIAHAEGRGGRLELGQVLPALSRTIRQRQIDIYSGVQPLSIHTDEAWAQAKGVAYYNLGVAYGINEQLEKAIENYNLAIGLNPDDAEAIFNRDLALLMLAEPGEKIGKQPHGKKEVTRSDLPEDMRRTTTRDRATQTKQVRKAQGKRTIKKRLKVKRTRMDRKKIE